MESLRRDDEANVENQRQKSVLRKIVQEIKRKLPLQVKVIREFPILTIIKYLCNKIVQNAF